jgi:hypothetical protein
LESFRTYPAEPEAANDKQKKPWYDEDVLEHILNDMALEIFPTSKHSYRRQVFYMKYHIFMGDGTTVKLFEKRVNWLNDRMPQVFSHDQYDRRSVEDMCILRRR